MTEEYGATQVPQQFRAWAPYGAGATPSGRESCSPEGLRTLWREQKPPNQCPGPLARPGETQVHGQLSDPCPPRVLGRPPASASSAHWGTTHTKFDTRGAF